MSKNVTDRVILKEVYDSYYQEFCAYGISSERSSKIHVPIDCEAIAKKLDLDPDIVFGRLYYHLDKKYRYTQDNGSDVHLFCLQVGGDRHTVNFPLLSAVLAEHESSYYRFVVPLLLSTIALLISIASYVASLT